MFKHEVTLEGLNNMGRDTMGDHLDMRFTDFGEDYLTATMPVSPKTVQPMRILHGGASVVLAETLGSVASQLCIRDWTKKAAVGVQVNANHLASVPEGGIVTGTVRPIRVGRTMHVWEIEIKDQRGRLTCVSRLTTMIVDRRG